MLIFGNLSEGNILYYILYLFGINLWRINEFGYKIEPFNMNTDRETGKIGEDGFFVFNKRNRDT